MFFSVLQESKLQGLLQVLNLHSGNFTVSIFSVTSLQLERAVILCEAKSVT